MATQKKSSSKKKSSGSKTSQKQSSGRKNTSSKRTKSSQVQAFPWKSEVLLFAVLACAILLFISNLGKGGVIGGGISAFFFGMFGILSYAFPFVLFLVLAFLISNRAPQGRKQVYSGRVIMKTVAIILLFLFLCVFAHLICYADRMEDLLAVYKECAADKSGGGLFGAMIGMGLFRGFGIVGAYVIDVLVLVVAVVLITERSFFNGALQVFESARGDSVRRKEASMERAQRRKEASRERAERRAEALRARREEREEAGIRSGMRREQQEEEGERRMDRKVSGVALDTKIQPSSAKKSSDNLNELHIEDVPDDALENPASEKASSVWGQQEGPTIHMSQPSVDETMQPQEATLEMDDLDLNAQQEEPRTQKHKKHTHQDAETVAEEVSDIQKEIEDASEQVRREYVFPELRLLKKGDPNAVGESRQHLQEMSAKLQMTLTNFGVNARVTNVVCGPSVTQYEIQPEVGVKVSKILGLADDIKLNLAVPDIRFEAPIPGKSAIGIEVPNKENVTVSFRELVESKEFQSHPSGISFCTGKDIAGNVIVADIAKMPHLLIAGSTGSGKSVCINTIIMSILYKASPDDVKLIMVDPKVVELSVYNGIPHLLIPVVTDPKKAAGALHWAVSEMMERYQTFQKYGVRDIKGYNKKIESIQDIPGENKPQKMPQIVIIVDELADLMMVAAGDVEDAICRLAQLARAAGMHLVIATQRPSVNVITGLIKANMPSRIAFAVTSGIDSRTILDMNGAEKLLGKGDMLFYPQSYQKPLRVQGAFVTDKEVSDVVEYIIEKNGQVSYNSEVEQKVSTSESSIGGGSGFTNSSDDRDAYFADAGKFIIEKEKGSIGMLQRMFKIGFNRAARIMDQLEEAGVVGPEEGTKPRRVLMSMEEFTQFLNNEQ